MAEAIRRVGIREVTFYRTSKGNGWNRDRVRAFRSHRDIPGYREGERRESGEPAPSARPRRSSASIPRACVG